MAAIARLRDMCYPPYRNKIIMCGLADLGPWAKQGRKATLVIVRKTEIKLWILAFAIPMCIPLGQALQNQSFNDSG